MDKTPNINDPISVDFAPNTWVTIQVLIVETKSIPALSEIMGTHSSATESVFGVFFPLRALVITLNPDGTYAPLNDFRTIAPEASRSTSKYVIAALAKFEEDCPPEESIVRTLLAKVDPVRQARTNLQYIKDAQHGVFDEIAKLYAGDRVDPRKRVATSAMLPFGQLARSTFQRIIKALQAKKKKRKPENGCAAPSDESGESKSTVSPDSDPHERQDFQGSDEIMAADSKTIGPRVQGELF